MTGLTRMSRVRTDLSREDGDAVCPVMERGSTAILDAYYASAKVLQPFRAQGLHLITRVRWSTVAHAPFCPRPGKHGPGRPRKWGAEVRLCE
jgi:hypothetical protein